MLLTYACDPMGCLPCTGRGGDCVWMQQWKAAGVALAKLHLQVSEGAALCSCISSRSDCTCSAAAYRAIDLHWSAQHLQMILQAKELSAQCLPAPGVTIRKSKILCTGFAAAAESLTSFSQPKHQLNDQSLPLPIDFCTCPAFGVSQCYV